MGILDSIIYKETKLPSGVTVKYNRFSSDKAPQIEPRTEYRNVDIIRGNGVTVTGTGDTNKNVKLSGNDCTVKNTPNLEFFGNRGSIYATPKQDNFDIYSKDSKIDGLEKNDKVLLDKEYVNDEEPGFLAKTKNFILGFLAAGGSGNGSLLNTNNPIGLTHPASPLYSLKNKF
ncbi:MAG TPA: hypothetical protein DDW90_11840 [Cyanobacteria bacterium UBA9971]|nr:hypothetical protein [Cyanobacteria bacterium UBA9971]